MDVGFNTTDGCKVNPNRTQTRKDTVCYSPDKRLNYGTRKDSEWCVPKQQVSCEKKHALSMWEYCTVVAEQKAAWTAAITPKEVYIATAECI